MIFKNWDKQDEKCPHCNQITKRVRGITKQNIRRLIIPRWDMNEFLITIMLIGIILVAFLYKSETQECRTWLKEFQDNPILKCGIVMQNETYTTPADTRWNPPDINWTKFNSSISTDG